MVSHGDPIKALLAHCLGMGRDEFQRLVVDPGSVSAIQLGAAREVLPVTRIGRRLVELLAESYRPATLQANGGPR